MSFSANNTGGEYNHKLTVAEMPSHTHNITIPISKIWNGNGGTAYQLDSTADDTPTYNYIGSTGGSGSHNNIQPYIVVYFWRRTT